MSAPAKLTRADVRRIAALARLELGDAELDLFARQLTDILEYACRLEAVDTAGVPPYAGGLAEDQWRDDAPVPSLCARTRSATRRTRTPRPARSPCPR